MLNELWQKIAWIFFSRQFPNCHQLAMKAVTVPGIATYVSRLNFALA